MLDVKDRKILTELILNSRIPVSKLSRKVGVSREVCMYRMSKLKKEPILGFYTLLNYEALGFRRYICFMQLKGITAEKEDEFLKYLAKHKYVTYLGPVVGKWNTVLDFIVRDEKHLKQVVGEIVSKAGQYMESYIVNSAEEEIFPTKYFDTNAKMSHRRAKTKYEVDKVDRSILKELAANSRIEYSELSRRFKISANAIKYRIKNLEKNNIIQGYTVSIDYRKLGYTFYNLQIKLASVDDEKFISHIKEHRRVMFYYKYLGHENWDIDIGIIAENALDFRKFIIELKNGFGELIKIHDMYFVAEITKDNVAPEGVFD